MGVLTRRVSCFHTAFSHDAKFNNPTAPSETSIDESAVSSDWTKFATEDSDS